MNRKQQRRERRTKNKDARARRRERIAYYRAHWCSEFGYPIKVMDEPTEEHIHMLLLVWLAPRQILSDVQQELRNKTDDIVLEALKEAMPKGDGLQANLWNHLFRLATHGFVVDAPPQQPTIKIW